MDTTHHSRPRTPLSLRLQSLLTDTSPRSSLDADRSSSSSSDDDLMWRSQAHRAAMTSASRSQMSLNNIPSSGLQSCNRPASKNLSLDLTQSASQLPIVRWFRGESSPRSEPSSASSSSTPPSALGEALEDDFFSSPSSSFHPLSFHELQKPTPACLPPHMNGRAAVRRSPPFLESLARSTLPTASVTRPPPVLRQPTGHSLALSEDGVAIDVANDETPCIDITQSPPSSNSLDSLRRLRDRGIPVAPDFETPSYARPFSTVSPTRWFFNKDRKADMDELLDESDRADTIEGEEAQMRKKCMTFSIYLALLFT